MTSQPPAPANQRSAPPPDGAGAEQPDSIEAPERPALAPNVELSGQMQESGFENQQWLAQREGRFVQLTELLYRVLEQANGERTLEEMAAGVSAATKRTVSADNVRHLVVKNLIPLGLVVKADGSVATVDDAQSRSPLAVNMRMAMVSPRYIDPVTAVLQPLYLPPVLIGVLLVTAATQGWLFFVKGMAGSMRDALYAPSLLLLLLAIIIISAAFHEFGHAAALRYGGGKVRGMGVGLYLVYPAFYTDVTDNYRLGRWARVRTDLGGFYFNLIFALIMMALYALTGSEFLFLVVLLVDLEIIQQSLPFVRLDGYWALADLTGIPDFFSQIGPFLRTVLPLPWWKGPKLPNLKGWVKAVFAVYILITVPLLLFFLFMMVRSVPRVLATAWDSFQLQLGAFSTARADGQTLGMLAAVAQMAILALPTFGLLYVLYSLGRRVVTAVWNWSKPTPARRAIGALGSLAALALLGYLWAPQLPFGRRSGPLYAQAQANFRPIAPDERGTLGDAVRDVAPVGFFGSQRTTMPMPVTTTVTPTAPASSTATLTPAVTATAGATAVPTATGTAGATTTPATTATAGLTPTISPTAGNTPTPTPTPTPTNTSTPTPGVTPTPTRASGTPTR